MPPTSTEPGPEHGAYDALEVIRALGADVAASRIDLATANARAEYATARWHAAAVELGAARERIAALEEQLPDA